MRGPMNPTVEQQGFAKGLTAEEFVSKFEEFLDSLLAKCTGDVETVEHVFAGPTVELFKVTVTKDDSMIDEWGDYELLTELNEVDDLLEGALSEYYDDGLECRLYDWLLSRDDRCCYCVCDNDEALVALGKHTAVRIEPAH